LLGVELGLRSFKFADVYLFLFSLLEDDIRGQ
jgi:hypothetical protein